MSRYLSELLGVELRELTRFIERIEQVTLHPGIDSRLTAEIIGATRNKMRRIGLDDTDTTPKELYYALQSKAQSDDELLREMFKINDHTIDTDTIERIVSRLRSEVAHDRVYCLQSSTVKKLLKAVPPKRTMRHLKFRSIESVLKRENPLLIYSLAKLLEEKTWHNQINARLKRLSPSDVTERAIDIISLPQHIADKLSDVSVMSPISAIPEAGIVMTLYNNKLSSKGSVLLLVVAVLYMSQNILAESLSFRFKALQVGYEKLMSDVSRGVIQTIPSLYGLGFDWHTVYRFFSNVDASSIGGIDAINSELTWDPVETRLTRLHTDLNYWENTHYIGVPGIPRAVSLHVLDVADGLTFKREFGHHSVAQMQVSLWRELQHRYQLQEKFSDHIMMNLTQTNDEVV